VGYYIRVLGTHREQPDLGSLSDSLRRANSQAVLQSEEAEKDAWKQLVLKHPDGPEIAIIECNPVIERELGQEELEEFASEVGHYQPASGAKWLKEYFAQVKVIYALQLLSGTDVDDGWTAVHAVQGAIWTKAGGILQADSEGFTNEDGYHILWQFSDGAKGTWQVAVLDGKKWIPFAMELGDPEQRKAFFEGKVPASVRLL
jgi:hypothetical protein